LAFAQRRVSGDFEVDEFGYDPDLAEHALLPPFRWLYRNWFRIQTQGLNNIPSTGGALVVANHAGTIALDSVMTSIAVLDHHPQHRPLRVLGGDLVFRMPFVGQFSRAMGSTLACTTDVDRLLGAGEVVGVWPEGYKGVGKPFSERYRLQRFGRGGFVAAALRAQVPIVPCAIVGSEEIYPLLGDLKPLARLFGMPYFPVTPTFPWLGALGAIPLPSRWIIEFDEPIDTSGLGPEAADDPGVVLDLTDQVRETIQAAIPRLLEQRGPVFG
jgi:1-acyl-sn-glycerol-3-phosphate acyltransferase